MTIVVIMIGFINHCNKTLNLLTQFNKPRILLLEVFVMHYCAAFKWYLVLKFFFILLIFKK